MLGFVSETELLLHLRQNLPAISASHTEIVERVKLRGVATHDELSEVIERVEDLAAALSRGEIVERDLQGSRLFFESALGVLSRVAASPVETNVLAAELKLSVSVIRRLLSNLGADIDLTDTLVSMAPHRYSTVVLDWSNTLVDESDLDDAICEGIGSMCGRDALRALLDGYQARYDRRWYDYDHLAGQFGLGRQVIDNLHRKHADKIRWLPRAQDLIRYTKRKSRVILATNCHRRILDLRLKIMNLSPDTFDLIFTSDVVANVRTKKAMFRLATSELKLEGDSVLVISDSFDRDVLPARAMNWSAIWYRRPTELSFWGTPGIPVSVEDFHLLQRFSNGRPLPNLVATDHRASIAWLEGNKPAR
jgi:FMN phosphatase YigB (HAD superfamily)